MGWLGNLFKGIVKKESEDLIFIENLPFPGLDTTTPIEADKHYVELRVEALRIEKASSFGTKFHGVVYSFVTLARQGEEDAVMPAISKPQKLAELDAGSIGKVITVSKEMMGAVPWRGDSFGLELGLFSVKSGNVLTPVVNFVTKVSETAGISFVGAVKPFVPLITEGLSLLAGQSADVKLEVGIDTNLTITHPMACAIIAARRDSLDVSRLSIDGDRRLTYDGQPLNSGYCIFSIRSLTQKADFGQIPELKDRFAELRAAAKGDDKKVADDALTAFRRAALLSPDLIRSDALRLATLAQQLVDDAFPAVIDRGPGVPEPAIPETLAELELYGAQSGGVN
jgi:hypothetical protein